MQYDVIVIGAGAAGLMCAATAGQRGRRVFVLDHASKLAEKIRISGGGRCNFTNVYSRFDRYLSANPHFCRSALSQFTPQDFIAMVERHGIAYHEKKLGQLFCDQSSEQIIQMLVSECEQAGVQRQMGVTIETVMQQPGGFQLQTTQGRLQSESLVVATGGLSIPQIGATPFGYQLAEQFGLPLTTLAPALVPLTFHVEDVTYFADLAGVSLDVEVAIGKTSFRENVLFTHKGLSGPAILQISSYWQPGQALSLNLLPDHDASDWLQQKASSEQLIANALAEFAWPKRFAEAWLARLDYAGRRLKDLSPKQRRRLAEQLHGWQLKPNGTQGYKKAEVTLGGVATQALSSKTMMANTVPGLFFIGEVVDVTGWLGGYNFQWAWSSGFVAGQHC
ncbi:NAD(P)/FAD-dependent oxidoreductase [Neisseriaceae bacterium TC5R-5]|nr:NAD(P)/FAD-dependent oxidoreductase [Neisseriaceae bacterium TC5R-5]